jgi:Tol biopolymer transport system component
MKAGFVTIVLVCACGSVNHPATPDAPSPDAPSPDAPPPRCDPRKPFGMPVPVTELNSTAGEGAPYLSPDELTVTFGSSRPGGLGSVDAYIATRSTPTGVFTMPSLIAGVNTAQIDNRPMITADGLTMYLETNLTGQAVDWKTAAATRTSTTASFGAWAAVSQLNSTTTDTAPYVLSDHSAIYFLSNRGTGRQLWRSTRTGGNWTVPVLVTGTDLNDTSVDYPMVTPDELTIYFSSSRVGGAGGRDIWVATRASLVEGFGEPVNVAALNSAQDESGGWVSADNCVIYFIRNVGAAAPNYDIFRAEKPL